MDLSCCPQRMTRAKKMDIQRIMDDLAEREARRMLFK